MSVFLDISLISFYVSLIAIITMISVKSKELKSGNRSFISRFADNTNHLVHDFYNSLKRIVMYINRKNAIALFQWIAYHILTWIREFYIWLRKIAHMHPPSKKVLDLVRGKGEVNKNGGSSIYLKIISDDRSTDVLK